MRNYNEARYFHVGEEGLGVFYPLEHKGRPYAGVTWGDNEQFVIFDYFHKPRQAKKHAKKLKHLDIGY